MLICQNAEGVHGKKKAGNPWSSSLGPEPDEVSQKGLKLLHLWCHSQKIRNPKSKIFFIADSKTCQMSSLLRVWTAL